MRVPQIRERLEVLSAKMIRGASEFWRAGLDFVFPPACLLCSREIPSAGVQKICPACQQSLAPLIPDSCLRCGAPVGPFLDTSKGCIHCKTIPFHFDGVVRLGVYKDSLRLACLAIKNRGKEPLAVALADLLWSRESARLEQANIELILTVPRHWTRRLSTGHNPSETLARGLARRLRVPWDGGQVRKTRRTPRQASLPRSLRLTNLREAFSLRRPQAIAGKNVLLVDDVLTTGTTANRICRLLKKAGAKSITVAVIARGLGDAR
jgi:ComF family protein